MYHLHCHATGFGCTMLQDPSYTKYQVATRRSVILLFIINNVSTSFRVRSHGYIINVSLFWTFIVFVGSFNNPVISIVS